MQTFLSFFKVKRNIWILCAVPLCIIGVRAFFFPFLSYPFWKMSLAYSGYSAAILLAICLAVSPFSQNFPTILLPRILNRHKREFGLSSFFYAALHVLSYFMRKVLKMGFFEWKSLLRLYLIPGEIAFLVLLTLALTSDPFWIKKLGWQKWKSIHRTVYIAEAGIFLHLCLNSSQKAFWGFAIFLPLFILQRLRLQK